MKKHLAGFSYWEILILLFLLGFLATEFLQKKHLFEQERQALFLEQASMVCLQEAEARRAQHQKIDDTWLADARKKLPTATVMIKDQNLKIQFLGETRELPL